MVIGARGTGARSVGFGMGAASVAITTSGRWPTADRKSTRLNSSHLVISYAVFCLKKMKPPMPVTTFRSVFTGSGIDDGTPGVRSSTTWIHPSRLVGRGGWSAAVLRVASDLHYGLA